MTCQRFHTVSRMRENCTYGSMRGRTYPAGASRSTLHPLRPIEVVGTDFASSLSCGVSSTAAETVMDAVETGVGEIFRMGEEQERLIEQIDVELDASGTFE